MTAATPAIKAVIDAFIVSSAMLIDRDDLDAWLDRFEDAARYIVTSRENQSLGLPAALIHCDSKASLKDRLVALRHANKFNPHYDRHIMGGTVITSVTGDVAAVESNFMIVQSTKTGQSRLFCAGCYFDRIRVSGAAARFVERVAVLDTFAVPTLLATPV